MAQVKGVYGHILAASCDQNGILRQIEPTHFPDAQQINVYPLLCTIKGILSDCVTRLPKSSQEQNEDPPSLDPSLHSAVNELSTELEHTSLNVTDVHHMTLNFFNMLSNYTWEAKLSLILAALVTIYGEYWVLIQSYSEEQLAKDMVTLLQLQPQLLADSDEQKSCFDKLNKLIKSMVDLTERIAEMNESLLSPNSADEATIRAATNTKIIASYWTVRIAVMCASYIHSLFGKAYTSNVGPGDIDMMTKKVNDLQAACQEKKKLLSGQKVELAKEVTIVAWGGPGGEKWTFKPEFPIQHITIVHGEAIIDSISFSRIKPNGKLESQFKVGGDGGDSNKTTAEVDLEGPSEHLMGISGTSGIMEEKEYIKSLKFHTNLKEYGPYGSEGQKPFELRMEDGTIVGFHGRAGILVDAIGVIVKQK